MLTFVRNNIQYFLPVLFIIKYTLALYYQGNKILLEDIKGSSVKSRGEWEKIDREREYISITMILWDGCSTKQNSGVMSHVLH